MDKVLGRANLDGRMNQNQKRPITYITSFSGPYSAMIEEVTICEVIQDEEGYLARKCPTSGKVYRLHFSPEEIRRFRDLEASGESWVQGLETVEPDEALPRVLFQGPVRARLAKLPPMPQTYRPTTGCT